MPVFNKSEMTMFSAEGEWNHPCEVKIGDRSITVSYQGEGQYVVYTGEEVECGHFKLQSTNPKGRATLHRLSNDDVLEGSWIESGDQGMWRIQIDE